MGYKFSVDASTQEQGQTNQANMDLDQMNYRCFGGYQVIGSTELPNYRFIINQRGVANVIPDKSSSAWGILFNLTGMALSSLDKYEEYPVIYTREELPLNFNGHKLTPWVYVDKSAVEVGLPRRGYFQDIIKAARSFYLPSPYIRYMESFFKAS